eukprot:3075799-Karenia_brevis.AAC.1
MLDKASGQCVLGALSTPGNDVITEEAADYDTFDYDGDGNLELNIYCFQPIVKKKEREGKVYPGRPCHLRSGWLCMETAGMDVA